MNDVSNLSLMFRMERVKKSKQWAIQTETMCRKRGSFWIPSEVWIY